MKVRRVCLHLYSFVLHHGHTFIFVYESRMMNRIVQRSFYIKNIIDFSTSSVDEEIIQQ